MAQMPQNEEVLRYLRVVTRRAEPSSLEELMGDNEQLRASIDQIFSHTAKFTCSVEAFARPDAVISHMIDYNSKCPDLEFEE